MGEKYRAWGRAVTVVFVILAVPIVLANAFIIIFSYMGGSFPWGSYIALGPSLVLSVFAALTSLFSLRCPDIRSFYRMQIVLILMLSSLVILFIFNNIYSVYAMLYSLTGMVQLGKYWRYAVPEIAGKTLMRFRAVMIVALIAACASVGFSMIRYIPKLPADKKQIRFISGSVQYHDDWSREVSLGKLAQDTEIQGMMLPKETFVFFYESGELMMVQLQDQASIIQGINCAARESVHFHKNGKISNAILAEDQTLNGIAYKKGYRLAFSEDGTLTSAKENDY